VVDCVLRIGDTKRVRFVTFHFLVRCFVRHTPPPVPLWAGPRFFYVSQFVYLTLREEMTPPRYHVTFLSLYVTAAGRSWPFSPLLAAQVRPLPNFPDLAGPEVRPPPLTVRLNVLPSVLDD